MNRRKKKATRPVPTANYLNNSLGWTKDNVKALYGIVKDMNVTHGEKYRDRLNQDKLNCNQQNRNNLREDGTLPAHAIDMNYKDENPEQDADVKKKEEPGIKSTSDWVEVKRNILVPDKGAIRLDVDTVKVIQATDKTIFVKLLHLLEEEEYKDDDDRIKKESQRLGLIRNWVVCLGIMYNSNKAEKSLEAKTSFWRVEKLKLFVTDFYCSKFSQLFFFCGISNDIFFLLAYLIQEDAYQIKEWYYEYVAESKHNSTKQTLHNPILPYRKSFCRLCYKYNCASHSLVKIDGIHSIATAHYDHYIDTATTNRKSTVVFKNTLLTCHFPDCVQKTDLMTGEYVPSKKVPEIHTWTLEDRRLCQTYFKSYGNSCLVALMMRNKTCTEVSQYIQRYPVAKPLKVAKKLLSAEQIEFLIELSPTVVQPCSHYGKCSNTCPCVIRKVNCEKMCSCSKSCPKRLKGCSCLTQCSTNMCPCFVAARECSLDLCKCARKRLVGGEGESGTSACKNMSIQAFARPHVLYVKPSTIVGLGLFTKFGIKDTEFVAEGVGEVISDAEADRRGVVYDQEKHTYLFSLETDGKSVDQTHIGNNTRYLNCSIDGNCIPRIMMVNGEKRLGYYAKGYIEPGSELTFNYVNVLKQHQIEIKSVTSENSSCNVRNSNDQV